MIPSPRRSVTRFFIPLIDVLILLFCIFLLMPFVSAPARPDEEQPEAKAPAPAALPTDVQELQKRPSRYGELIRRLPGISTSVSTMSMGCSRRSIN